MPALNVFALLGARGARRVWHLPFDARSTLLPVICCELPLLDTLCSRFTSFIAKYFSSKSFSVRDILRFGLYERGTHSLVERNAQVQVHFSYVSYNMVCKEVASGWWNI